MFSAARLHALLMIPNCVLYLASISDMAWSSAAWSSVSTHSCSASLTLFTRKSSPSASGAIFSNSTRRLDSIESQLRNSSSVERSLLLNMLRTYLRSSKYRRKALSSLERVESQSVKLCA
ncbi:hypothetical protein BJX66DRAFT_316259 [Aspergillus keveii]|uniref:Secreted protein n=1 Tax=Aspergillus keveii TaxID=714993 RepID=A0ABR4FNA1_9EURO